MTEQQLKDHLNNLIDKEGMIDILEIYTIIIKDEAKTFVQISKIRQEYEIVLKHLNIAQDKLYEILEKYY